MSAQPLVKWTKVRCRKVGQRVMFVCPYCRKEQELPLGMGRDDFQIQEAGPGRGRVHPNFVCMNKATNGHYCEFSGPLWLIDY